MTKKKFLLLWGGLLTLFLVLGPSVQPSPAQISVYWTGASNEHWFNDANWAPSIVPDGGTDAFINGKIGPNYPIIYTYDAYARSLTLGGEPVIRVN